MAAPVNGHGYTLERGDCAGANVYTDPATRTVRVRADVDVAQAVKTGYAAAGPAANVLGTTPTIWAPPAVTAATLLVLFVPDVRRITRRPEPPQPSLRSLTSADLL